MIDPKSALGKPLVVYIDGERRQIGTITRAVLKDGAIFISATLDLKEDE
jgi:hypothetical protein